MYLVSDLKSKNLRMFLRKSRKFEKSSLEEKYLFFEKVTKLSEKEQDNIFEGKDKSTPPQPFCQSCDGIMTPVSYNGIQGVTYTYNS